ncbi:MAG TPA: SRPBCC family protein [Nocardioidaceae bacterium]|nr:SRPBCC family protein [Nocardioidaceae bacterium]
MTRIEGSIDIRCAPEVVFDYVADQRNEPRYNPHMLLSEKVTDGPVEAGTRFRAMVAARRIPRGMDIELTGYDRPHHLASTTTMSSGKVTGTIAFVPIPEGTRMSWVWDVEPLGSARVLTPLIKVLGHRQERAIWTGLKRHLEQREKLRPLRPPKPHPEAR